MRRAIALLALVLVAAACGGSDDAATDEGPAAGAAESETTVVDSVAPADPNREAAIGDLISVDYAGTLDDGSQFDSSIGREPLQFIIGSGQVIAGFDDAVKGLKVGESVTVRLTPEEAYGEYQDELVQEVPLENLPEGTSAGDELFSPQGQRVIVIEVGIDSAMVDFNHELADQALTFEITLVSFDS